MPRPMGTPSTTVKKEGPPGSSSCHCPATSAILLKAVMAVTGLILFGFVIVHALGNLLVFLPDEAINGYGYFLHHAGVHGLLLIWPFRLFLLAAAVAHIVAAIILTKRNRAARPVPYAKMNANGATLASRTMFVGGLVLAVFIVFHILQFTVEAGPFAGTKSYETQVPGIVGNVHDVHRMMVHAFRNVWISGFYLVSVAFLGLHLYHGSAALFRSLGLGNRATFPWQDFIARAFGAFTFLAMAAIPLAILFGIVK